MDGMWEGRYRERREGKGRGRGHAEGEGPTGRGKTFPLLLPLTYIDMFSLPTCSAPSLLSQTQHRWFCSALNLHTFRCTWPATSSSLKPVTIMLMSNTHIKL